MCGQPVRERTRGVFDGVADERVLGEEGAEASDGEGGNERGGAVSAVLRGILRGDGEGALSRSRRLLHRLQVPRAGAVGVESVAVRAIQCVSRAVRRVGVARAVRSGPLPEPPLPPDPPISSTFLRRRASPVLDGSAALA